VSNLTGCWRYQQVELHLQGGQTLHDNYDCVETYNLGHMTSECRYHNGIYRKSDFSYAATGDKTILITPVAVPNSKEPPHPPTEVTYEVSHDWLIKSVTPSSTSGDPAKIPRQIVTVLDRAENKISNERDSESSDCHPRGPSQWDNFSFPKSSLKLSAPDQFIPLNAGFEKDQGLANAISGNFLVGVYVMRGSAISTGPDVSKIDRLVIVTEDSKQGTIRVGANEFQAFKKRLKNEIGTKNVSCEDSKRICFHSKVQPSSSDSSQSKYVVSEFLNINGRVAIVASAVNDSDAYKAKLLANQTADMFAKQMEIDNP